MLDGLRWLALEVKDLDPAVAFYREHLDLPVRERDEREARLGAGESALVLRRPDSVPRGGLHTHFALSTPADQYDDWWDRLSDSFDLEEHQFGPARSLYFYDVVGNCVEIGQRDDAGEGITGIFEVVLEVADLDRAESFYRALGMDLVDRGDNRKRVRLTAGPFDLELWEPHLGLADARGGVHVDLGLATTDSEGAVAAVDEQARTVQRLDDGIRLEDPDGHWLTLQ
jgi:catechol 2,3-dioxygenase-like lactoylglutathione lyase family enzyme